MFSKIKHYSVYFVNNGGWHFSNIKSPEDLEIKMLNFLHHVDYEQSGLTLDDLKKLIREKKVIKSMKAKNIDALLLFRQESMYWLTGYDTFGYVFFQTLILDKNGNTVLLTRAPDLRQAQNTSNIKNIIIWEDKETSSPTDISVSYTHLRAHETREDRG